ASHLLVRFFFQAEDGIRDRNVTGVQTCALPIYSYICIKGEIIMNKCTDVTIEGAYPLSGTLTWPTEKRNQYPAVLIIPGTGKLRSEERRVGKSVEIGGRGTVRRKNRLRRECR